MRQQVPELKEVRLSILMPTDDAGNYEIIQELERTVAQFVGKPSAMVFGMGFATNSTTIPALCGKVFFIELSRIQ